MEVNNGIRSDTDLCFFGLDEMGHSVSGALFSFYGRQKVEQAKKFFSAQSYVKSG